jgi:hypothetical protein
LTDRKLDDCQSVDEIADYLTGRMSEHYLCIDCGHNTHPGAATKREVAEALWRDRQNGVEWQDTVPMAQTLRNTWCAIKYGQMRAWSLGAGASASVCLEKRLGRRLRPKDFQHRHPFNTLPGSERLLKRRK